MDLASLFRLPQGMRLLRLTVLPKIVHIEAASCRKRSRCPSCQTPSERVHSSSSRTLTDVPCIGRGVVLQVRVRKFRCATDGCDRRVFAERFPDFVQPKARKTTRADDACH